MTIHLLKTGLLNEGRLHFLATLQKFLAKRRSQIREQMLVPDLYLLKIKLHSNFSL